MIFKKLSFMDYIYILAIPSALVILLAFYYRFEPLINPPVSDFILLDIRKTDDTIVISGVMDKDRDCVLRTVTADGLFENSKIAHSLRLDFSLDDEINLPGLGEHKHWGPWTIRIQREKGLHNVILKSVHKCDLPWEVVTHLTTMPINYAMQKAYQGAVERGEVTVRPDTPQQRALDAAMPKSFEPAYGYTLDDPRHPYNKGKK